MLDFHGLFASYVALFSGGVYMEIESLRLDLHLKRKQKKPQGQHRRRKKKKKKNPEKKVFEEDRKEKKKTQMRDLGSPRSDLGRATTWVARRATLVVAPRRATRSRRDLVLLV